MRGKSAMWLWSNGVKRYHKGQNLLEYATIAAVITAAVVAMSTYVYRSVQATQQAIQEESQSSE
jgi:Flp pilus assembly pilin Flp